MTSHRDVHPDILDRALGWFLDGDTGMSSESIARHMLGRKGRMYYPSDEGDMGRCVRLLEAVPEWRPRMNEMAQYGGGWLGIAEKWDELTAMYHDKKSRLYEAMKTAASKGEGTTP